MEDLEKPKRLLKKYFGFDKFRPAQEIAVKSVLSGRDTLAVMPTGAGKSICFQIPALIYDGLTIVISPLISLMKDQVDSLNTDEIPATYLNGTLSRMEINERLNELRQGKYKLLYIAPERMGSYELSSVIENRKVSLIAVDEAHCISHWGHDFRPQYCEISRFVQRFSPRPVVAAFTATATPRVREDICNLLNLEDPIVHISGFDRPNLFFKVLKNIDKDAFTLQYVEERKGESGIIYAATQKEVERLHLFLLQNNIKAARYHAGLSDEERNRAQDDFLYDRADVIVATLAFGMGIDKNNVRYCIHYNMPKSIEGYYQEAGRAGRDGERSECILLYAPKDVETQKFLITHSSDDCELDPNIIAANMALLQKMASYCHTPGCLRHYILSYFNEKDAVKTCGNCGNCLSDTEEKDITVEAQMILSCVYRMKERKGMNFGAALTANVLAGSKSSKVTAWGFQNLSTYGLMKNRRSKDIKELIDILISMDCLRATNEQYPTLFLTEKSGDILRGKEKVFCRVKSDKCGDSNKLSNNNLSVKHEKIKTGDDELFEKLKTLRKEIADREHKPAFMIFSDATLRLMTLNKPGNLVEMLEIQGVGEKKLQAFGEDFLRVINEG